MSKPWTPSRPPAGRCHRRDRRVGLLRTRQFLLVVLGIGGAWGSRLVAMQAYQPLFIAAAVASFGYAWFQLYRRREACATGEVCAVPAVRRRQRAVFWAVSVAAALMAFPLYAPLFY